MTRAPELTSINCTNCGAGLDVLGGGRVKVHICSYCGSELDAQEDYRILRRYSDLERPASPFRIGMTGQIFGVDWTVIGTIGKQEPPRWAWVEHQLYSPTHGYAWLVVDKGHLTFSRRVRRVSTPPWMGERWVESAESKPTVRLNGDLYTYYETSLATVTFIEGEFTFRPEMGKKGLTISAMSQNAMLDFSEAGNEREMYRSTYLDAEAVAAAFGQEEVWQPRGMHPLKPFRASRNAAFLKVAAGVFALVSLVAALAMMMSGTTRMTDRVMLADLPQTLPFEVSRTEQLVEIGLRANPMNAWSYVELEVIDPEEETLFEAGRSMEYYTGRDSDGTWSEGSRNATLRFRPTVPGTYQLVLHEAESELWHSGGRGATQVELAVREGVQFSLPLFGLTVIFGLMAAVPIFRRMWHRSRRWSGSDWTEED